MRIKMTEDKVRKLFTMVTHQKFLDETERLRIHLGLNSKSDVLRFLVRQEYSRLYGIED
jgi:hypothetical protein